MYIAFWAKKFGRDFSIPARNKKREKKGGKSGESERTEKKRKRKEDKTNQLIDLLTISYHLFLVYAMFQFDIFLVIL